MAGRLNTEYKESKYASDLVRIMRAETGPYTRSMLANELSKLYPAMYWQELMNEVSFAIQIDKWPKANRFQPVNKKGYYILR